MPGYEALILAVRFQDAKEIYAAGIGKQANILLKSKYDYE